MTQWQIPDSQGVQASSAEGPTTSSDTPASTPPRLQRRLSHGGQRQVGFAQHQAAGRGLHLEQRAKRSWEGEGGGQAPEAAKGPATAGVVAV